MATFDKLLGIQNGVNAVAQSGDTIDFNGITLSNFSADSISDGTGTVDFGAAGALQETGLTSVSLSPSGAMTLTAGAASTWSTSAGALTITSAVGATWSTASGVLVIDGAAGLSLAGNSGEIDLTTTGVIDINSAAGTWDATGGLNLSGSGAPSSFDSDGQDLTIQTTTSGDIAITSAGAVDVTTAGPSDWGLPDNETNALSFEEGPNPYMTFQTTDNQEQIKFRKPIAYDAVDGTAFTLQNGFSAGENLTQYHVVALDYDVDGARLFTCQSDDAETVRQNAYGVVLAGTTAGNAVPVAVNGVVNVICTDAVSDTGADIGAFVFVDDGAKAGQVTTTAPTAGRVYKLGIIVAGNGGVADSAIKVALQPQFLYDN